MRPSRMVGRRCRAAHSSRRARRGENPFPFVHGHYNRPMSDRPSAGPGRRTPAKGVSIRLSGPNWVFLTVCTTNRERWLAETAVQQALHDIWKHTATAWLVSDYLLMPDHLHLFCAPRDLKFTIERWIGFWKDRFAKAHGRGGTFQAGGFHHRLREAEGYAQKWQYVLENPVRQGLVERAEDWPYFGRVHEIRW